MEDQCCCGNSAVPSVGRCRDCIVELWRSIPPRLREILERRRLTANEVRIVLDAAAATDGRRKGPLKTALFTESVRQFAPTGERYQKAVGRFFR